MAKTKNDVTTDEGAQALDEINANIERAGSLTDADALTALEAETEELIASLSGKGSIAVKTEKRDQMRSAAARAVVGPDAEAKAPAVTYDEFEGVTELVSMGATKLAEGVRLQVGTSKLASEIAQISVDMWLRLPNSDGDPDLMGTSARARQTWRDILKGAGEGFERTAENEDALNKLQRSVQDYRSDVRAQHLRGLDGDDKESASYRERYSGVLANKPADVTASRWLANHYGTSLVGQSERKSIAYHLKKGPEAVLPEHLQALAALEPGLLPGAAASDDLTPDEQVATLVKRLTADVSKAKSADLGNASEEAKKKAREELVALVDELKGMVTALL
ncbi:hypothetical protein [Streptomyces sp. NPDC055006]